MAGCLVWHTVGEYFQTWCKGTTLREKKTKTRTSFSTRKGRSKDSHVVLVLCCVQIHARAIKKVTLAFW